MRKFFTAFLFLFILQWAGSQTINNLPRIIVTPFEDISAEAKKEGIGETVMTMFRTALDKSLVFSVPSTLGLTDYSLSNMKRNFAPASLRSVFLVEGYSSLFGSEIQTDVRIYDLYTEKLVTSFYLKVNNVLTLREQVNNSIKFLEQDVFRDTLSSLNIQVTQGVGDIYLDGKFMGTSNASGNFQINNLFPGNYKLKVLAAGFMDYEEVILIRPRHISNLTVTLSQEPGILVIDSNPQGADILINGNSVGVTPKKFEQFEPGEYSIELGLTNYKKWKVKLAVESRQEKKINAGLEINPGSVNIVTVPQGIDVYRDGEHIGYSPLRVPNLVPGKYLFELKSEGFVPYDLAANVLHGEESSYDVEMVRETGLVSFITKPPGAKVVITHPDGSTASLGITPLEKIELPVGYYKLSYQLDGFGEKNVSFDSYKESVTFVENELYPLPGSIRIGTDPSQANIYIDGRYKGVTPMEVGYLEPGTYKVMASTAFGSETKEVTVAPGEVSEVEITIEKNSSSFLSGILITAISVAAYLSVIR